MISVSRKKWIEKKVNKNLIEKIKQDLNYSEILSKLIVLREFDISELVNINNDLKITNIFKNNSDFNDASNQLIDSIKNKENTCVLGDYDVDGSASTALLVRFFNNINHPHFYYIPDREKDGYGASKKLFQKLILKKPKLVIMVDCGSTSNEAIQYLNENNIKSIIIDHHEINKPFPNSNIIINPKKNNGYQEYNYLCATTLTYFFLDIVIKKNNYKFRLANYLIYVVLASVCDVMPLRKLNRQIALNVINKFKITENIAFETLFKLNNRNNKITIDDLGFFIGPIINSGGRLGKSNLATELLSSNDHDLIIKRSHDLIKLNNKRKEIEKNILDEIDFKKIEKDEKNVIIYYNPNINEGLIGIIAARLKEYFNKPSIVITKSNNIFKGSARSTNFYNIGSLIKTLYDKKIIDKGGGHNMAAGFIMKKNNIKIMDDFIQKDFMKMVPNLVNLYYFDACLSASAVNMNFMNELKKLEPYGNGNLLPIFLFNNLKIIKVTILNNKHISVILKPKNGSSLKSICFNCMNTKIAEYLLSYKKEINVIAQIQENIWNNKKTLQLIIKDILI